MPLRVASRVRQRGPRHPVVRDLQINCRFFLFTEVDVAPVTPTSAVALKLRQPLVQRVCQRLPPFQGRGKSFTGKSVETRLPGQVTEYGIAPLTNNGTPEIRRFSRR